MAADALLDAPVVLAVDDHQNNLDLVDEILSGEGFVVDTALDGETALALVARRPPDCIVLDVMMPGIDGVEVARRLKGDAKTFGIPIVMLTALSDVDDKIRALDAGADDFLNKPVVREELLARVNSLVKIKRLHDELDTSENIIFSMARALEAKQPSAAGHSERVAVGAIRLGRALALPPAVLEDLAKAALLHDLGKIGVPERILEHGPQDSAEVAAWRAHTEIGERILAPLRGFAGIRDVLRHHHERLDGTGWPDGVAGDKFSTLAEIVAIVNSYQDAAAAHGAIEAAARLRQEASMGRFRPDPVALFLEIADAPMPAGGPRSLLPLVPHARPGSVMIADDHPHNRELVVETLSAAGHQVQAFPDGRQLLEAIAVARPDLVVCDVRMPGIDGISVCAQLKGDPATEFVPVILVTAAREGDTRRKAIVAGAADFLSVPLHRAELVARVASLLRVHQYYLDLEEHQAVILSLATALEAKDPYTHGHSERVGHIARDLALELGLPSDQCELMLVAGLLHDIGKIGVPEKLLNKRGKLTDEEFLTIMTHPPSGEIICRPLRSVQRALPLIKHHHERWNGSGYPDHLAGEAIPMGARVLAVADAFDALTSERSYRKRLPDEEALAILRAETTEKQLWDPDIFAALEAMIERRGPLY